jgi:hypothetical protein
MCERPLVARPRADGVRRYVCARGPGHPGCGRIFVVATHIEPFISDAVLHRLSSPQLATALASHGDDPATTHAMRDINDDQALLEELAASLGRKEIGLREWQSARAPITERLTHKRALLTGQTKSRAVDDLLASPGGIRAAYENLTLSQQHAVIAAVLNYATVGPAVRGRNRFDPSRVSPEWRV